MRKKLLIAISIMLCILCQGCGEERLGLTSVKEERPDDYVQEFVDRETGVHYLLYSKSTSGTTGGITPRLNADGSIMIDEIEGE